MNSLERKFSLLIVDDDPRVIRSLERVFAQDGYQILSASSGPYALALMREVRIDAALIDWKMPDMDGLALLKEMRDRHPQIMSIMVTGHGGVQEAVEAMRLGAVDFMEKPFSVEGLRARVGQLYRIWELSEENRRLKAAVDFQFGFDRFVGNSRPILDLKQVIVQVASSDGSVLIQGETGTGKELVAKAIHHHSPFSANNFVPVDCAAISETIMESELFGHVKGAFTGAHTSTLGLIRSADKGTLFLDEVGEIPLHIQARLLRTTQENEVRPVGSSKSYPIQVRIVAATNRDLREEISRGTFREDLFYRLNVFTLEVPPLRDRKEDIPLLARYFIKRFQNEYSPVKDLSQEAQICLENYQWPGNVRELENVIRRAVALGKREVILPEDLPPSIHIPPGSASLTTMGFLDDTLAGYEIAAIRNALAKAHNNRRKAAQILGIGEATLYRKIGKYNLEV